MARVETVSSPAEQSREFWTPEVDLILSAMDAALPARGERRHTARMPYRVRAELKLFADAQTDLPRVLFTRDVSPRGLGFITPHRLPLGYGGWLELLTPRGSKAQIGCTIYRCCQAAADWYEGALYFNREQPVFTPE